MTESNLILIEDSKGVRMLTLNRPQSLNATNSALLDELTTALQEASVCNDIACVIITGQGRAFTAGTDLAELASPPIYTDGKRHGFEPFIETVERFNKPLIAAVNGLAVGIGVTLLPHCDLVLVAASASFKTPFVSLGVTAEAGSTYLLPKTIGMQETAHMLFTASWFDADKALEIGLAYKKFADVDLLDEAVKLAQEIARQPVVSLVATKQLLIDARLGNVRAARAREIPTFANLVGGAANVEAIAAFKEKREANFNNL
ncbi:MAG: enoyl-CoA hydratase/carnithine racemase [Oceanicoccus sp.]|jgi:enoyl-CoA hydratase/carnithine racemase